ncbi:MAG: hypothetical protein ACI9TY_000456 [Alphaproteobacteria bacterium]|jgi:hypothetical protein
MAENNKKTTKNTVSKKAVKKTTASKRVKKVDTPMTFHDNPKKNIAWYAVSAALVSVVVLANILPSDTLIGMGEPLKAKPVVARTSITIPTKVDIVGGPENIRVNESELITDIQSMDELEVLLQKNVESVENALKVITKRELRTVEQLDAISKTALGLDVRLAQLQQEIITLQQKKDEETKIQNPSRIFLGQMMIFLTDSYNRGNVSHKQLNNLKDFSNTVAHNEKMVEAVAKLIAITPDEGPVTLTELALLAGRLMQQGAPEVEDLLQEPSKEEGYVADAKRYLADWVEVKKLSVEGENQPWVIALNNIQQALSRGNVDKAQAIIAHEKSFERDTRVNPFKAKIKTYIKQQAALNDVVSVYSDSYVMSVQ